MNIRKIAKISVLVSPKNQNNSIEIFDSIFKDKQYIIDSEKIRIKCDDIGKIKQIKVENEFHYEFICYCFEYEIQYKNDLICQTIKKKVEPIIDEITSFRFNYNLLTSKLKTPCKIQ